jgi:hypothetical protein
MTVASGAKSSTGATLATQAMPRAGAGDPSARSLLTRYPIALAGALAVVAGVVAQVVSLVSLTWWQGTVHGRDISMRFEDFGPRAWRGFAFMYFSWGAWLIAGVTLGLGVAGCIRWSGARVFRIAGAVFAVIAALAPIAALLVFAYQSDSDMFHVVRDYAIGPYIAVLGTMATAFGVVAGSAR